MPETNTFEYAIVRVVPRVERGEFVNAGVVLYCRAAGFLEAAIELDADRLRALDPEVDLKMVESHLASFTRFDLHAGLLASTSICRRRTTPGLPLYRQGHLRQPLHGCEAALC